MKTVNQSLALAFSLVLSTGSAFAQTGVPLPGSGWAGTDTSAPVPGQQVQSPAGNPAVGSASVGSASVGSPPPGGNAIKAFRPDGKKLRPPKAKGDSAYGALPLSVADAKESIVELRNIVLMSKPQDSLERVGQMSEWLADIADAHSKMANTFSKQESTKAQASSERQAAGTFYQLKREVELIKAEILISQKRYPEALAPLVSIVVAEPTSATGKKAYDKLKDLGFSEDSALTVATGDEARLEAASVTKPTPKNVKNLNAKPGSARASSTSSLDGRKNFAVAAARKKTAP